MGKEGGQREEQMVEGEKEGRERGRKGEEEKERENKEKEKRMRGTWDLNIPLKDRTPMAGRCSQVLSTVPQAAPRGKCGF